jgi:hypothetical protein
MDHEQLQTIAEVAATLAGFTGVVFVLGRRSAGQLTNRERNGLFHMLLTTLGTMLFALIVTATLTFSDDQAGGWRIGCALAGTCTLFGASRAVIEKIRGEQSLPAFLAWPVPIGAILLAVGNFLLAWGPSPALAPIACVSILIYLLLVATVYFVSLLAPDGAST